VIYLVAAVPGIGATLYAGPMLVRDLRDETVVKDADGRLPAVPWRPMLLLCVVMTLAYIGESSVTNAGSVYLTKGLNSSDSLGGLVVGAYTLGEVLGRLRGDALVQRFGGVKVVRAGAALCALGFVTVVAAAGPYMALAGFLIAGIGLSPLVPQAFTTAHANDPTGSGVAVARINVFNYLGFLLGAPLVTGLWGAGVSHRAGMAVPTVMIALIIVLAYAFDPRRVRAAENTGATPAVGGAETVPTLGS
jgi:MFS family permease